MDKKVYSLLGLCKRASRLSSGEFMTEKAVKNKTAKLVIVAADSSKNTKKLFNNICFTHKVKLIEFGTKEELGRAIGKDIRASICILDEGFAKAIEENTNFKT
ncbi:L7Ae/L30e/S12e/Gadd45 family ribosomal protein [Vallitalea guaymasensis]|uniref:Ribosomal L7Ae/L30e/S12e/Gadd45 family protein n=1 Tax=Vallitalea guaymasensis TaxID=1185412 RepID=A0A8J8MFD5_9FIRM|nr:ribosomal L7Ae/L30e/S12e/Gadd45 family protein [Vallitalea guaymasensis]QUH31863.1 ribosomal L7Ae/L30e/S12e/Gadd45 family protein [Vallitalea guaymasensis]